MKPFFVTTCMGRRPHLEQTLPTWLANSSWSIVVVDYSCPQGVGDWAEAQGERVRVVRVQAEQQTGRPIFNLSRARHLGALAAIQQGADWLYMLDADNFIRSTASWTQDPNQFQIDGSYFTQLRGFLGVSADHYLKTGGYDPAFTGWTCEDLYMRFCLHAILGVPCERLPPGDIEVIIHSDDLRTANYVVRDPGKSKMHNLEVLLNRIESLTGKNLIQWVRQKPDLFRLLAVPPPR